MSGSRNIAPTGRNGSIAWTSTCANCKRSKGNKPGRSSTGRRTKMAEASNSPSSTGEALVIERIFGAPRELVWKAWTEPERMMRWWGPRGFTSPVCEVDFRVGGKIFAAMQSPDFNEGRPIWSTGVYKEIVPLQRLVTTDSFADENGNVVPASEYGMTND